MNSSIINYDVLWDRISNFAIKSGRVTTRPMLLLFFVMKSKQVPIKDKMLIFSTLSYLVLPIDILDVKKLPLIGWFDEIGAVSVAISKVKKHITPEIEDRVDAVLDRWFSEFVTYELIEEQY